MSSRIVKIIILLLINYNCQADNKSSVLGLSYKAYSSHGCGLIHVVDIDPSKIKIVISSASDLGATLATVPELAQHFSAIAAINGGFFRIDDQKKQVASPAGALKINHQWHGIAYQARGAIGWDPSKNLVLFDILQTKSKKLKLNDKNARVATFLVRAMPQIEPSQAKVWDKLPFIISAGPLLIKQSKIISNFSREQLSEDFIHSKYSRTAVGVLANKHWVFVVAPNNLLDEHSGLTLPELSAFMHSIGCVFALNLDGGGSSSLYMRDQDIANISFARPVANALLALPSN